MKTGIEETETESGFQFFGIVEDEHGVAIHRTPPYSDSQEALAAAQIFVDDYWAEWLAVEHRHLEAQEKQLEKIRELQEKYFEEKEAFAQKYHAVPSESLVDEHEAD